CLEKPLRSQHCAKYLSIFTTGTNASGPEGIEIEARHKIVDWEAGALYWNLRRKHGAQWETPFRNKVERELPSKDLTFLMGTIHRFPDQWLIISLIYPPRRQSETAGQLSLL
ncbi:MAG TPA: hypothetical protein VHV26_01265, partial [Rhizomicrobium sp.]|nr:hypothetical protein [Rhizomicrobium sp.]